MKTVLFLPLIASLSYGCRSSEESTAPQFMNVPAPPPEAPQEAAQPAPFGEAPSVIFVDGEFMNPGRYAWTNGMTLNDAFAAAGGFTDFARKRIRLRHWDGTTEYYRWSVHSPLTNNPALKPGDQILNPRD
jgi:protein involved in polysaccharide export with SLBB domain